MNFAQLTKIKIFWIVFIPCTLLISILAAYTFTKASFRLNAESEILEIDNPKEQNEQWPLQDVTIVSSEKGKIKFTGSLYFTMSSNRKIIITRKFIENVVVNISADESIGQLFNINGSLNNNLGNNVKIIFPCSSFVNRTMILPFKGNIVVGQYPIFGRTEPGCQLQSGSVSLRGQCLFTNQLYEASSTKLLYGEVFKLSNESYNGNWIGYMVLDKNPGFRIYADAVAKEGVIMSYTTDPSVIKINIAERLKNDWGMHWVWISMLWLMGIFKLINENINKDKY